MYHFQLPFPGACRAFCDFSVSENTTIGIGLLAPALRFRRCRSTTIISVPISGACPTFYDFPMNKTKHRDTFLSACPGF